MVTTLRPTETPAQAIRRLAEKARSTGVGVFQYEPTNEWYSNSRSAANTLHRVTLVSCDCLGFQRYSRCSHHSALLDHLGQLPTDPPPPPVVLTQRVPVQTGPVVTCPQCAEVMGHVIACSFECGCGGTFEVDPQTADLLDAEICALSWRDSDVLDEVIRLLSVNGDVITPGWDGDQCPCREDAPSFLDRFNISSNELAAVLVWQDDRREVADRFAA